MDRPWLSPEAYEHLAANARARGMEKLSAYFAKRAHEAFAAREQARAQALAASEASS